MKKYRETGKPLQADLPRALFPFYRKAGKGGRAFAQTALVPGRI